MLVNSIIPGGYNIPDDEIITMVRPILGFENLNRFCLIDTLELEPFALLQSVDDPDTVFLVVDPRIFVNDYDKNIASKDVEELSLSEENQALVYSIVTMNEKAEDITINLSGPILLNQANRKAKQIVLTDSNLTVQHRIITSEETVVETIETEEPVLL